MRLALVLAVLALVAAGCSRANVLDSGQVGDVIATQIAKQTGADIESVRCPQEIEAEAGGRFRCTVTAADGTEAAIVVRQTSDEGNLAFEAPLLHTTDTEEQIANDLGASATVDCPELVLVAAGTVFRCRARIGGDEATLEVRLEDAGGNFEYEVLGR